MAGGWATANDRLCDRSAAVDASRRGPFLGSARTAIGPVRAPSDSRPLTVPGRRAGSCWVSRRAFLEARRCRLGCLTRLRSDTSAAILPRCRELVGCAWQDQGVYLRRGADVTNGVFGAYGTKFGSVAGGATVSFFTRRLTIENLR